MTGKRSSSYLDDSDDDFQASDPDDNSSRLKRPRRTSARPVDTSPNRTPDNSSVLADDDVRQHPAGIPESLDQDERSVDAPTINSAPGSPAAERGDDVIEVDESDAEDSGGEGGEDDNNDDVHNSDNDTVKPSPKQKPKSHSNYIESDSESDDAPSVNSDDEAYNSVDDSANDEDLESEYELSPKKPAKKKAVKPMPNITKPSTPKKTKAPVPKRPAYKSAPKPFRSVALGKTASKLSSSGGRKVLGTRMPLKGTVLLKTQPGRRKSTGAAPSRKGGAMLRAGLSRNAAIPRLHPYLSG